MTERKRDCRKLAAGRKRRDPFVLYQQAVQDAAFEVRLCRRIYRTLRGAEPVRFREDFAGTALLACEWVRRVPDGLAQAVDIDRPTLEWGRRHNVAKLGARAARVTLVHGDVRTARGFRPDVVAAMNFSYFVFKRRRELLDYFRAVHKSLAPRGVFVIDLYGGPEAQMLQEETTRHAHFTYVWDQKRYNPITGETLCHIHFRFPDGERMRRAFTYDWRLWSLPELRDALAEAGFQKTVVYWEGTNRRTGAGNGVYRISEKGDTSNCWIAYIAAAR
ncbi:MAG: class I SAM-dependent methyltransferase [Kiritimatiellae bacterium]|nr:class I SAM-dependent methyltransferase [Kiritimatiellia bacterium]